MKSFIHLLSFASGFCLCLLVSIDTNAQSLLGKWQLVKQTSCLENEMEEENDTIQPLVDQMTAMSSAAPQIVTFKEKNAGEESTRILNKRRTTNNKNFLYKFDGEMLLILDKKSQTIVESFVVDKFEADSLIISSSSRPCETRIFLKIKEPK